MPDRRSFALHAALAALVGVPILPLGFFLAKDFAGAGQDLGDSGLIPFLALGGLVTGTIYGLLMAFLKQQRRDTAYRAMIGLALTLVSLVGLGWLIDSL